MPGGDRTGPMGQGARTGRGAGFCEGYNVPGYANPGFGYGFRGGLGRGFGHGRGGGRGWRHRYYATGLPGWARAEYPYSSDIEPALPQFRPRMAPHDELKMLRGEAESCEEALKNIRARIDELEQKRAARREE